MKKVTVLALLVVFNFGAAGSDLIFYNGFESGWPNAWAQAVGWSAFHVKDSTGTLVGPVVGWVTDAGDIGGPVGIPLVAVWIDGDKVIFNVLKDRLFLGLHLQFSGSDCEGQAYLCTAQPACGAAPGDPSNWRVAQLRGMKFALDEHNVLYKAEPPALARPPVNSDIKWSTNINEEPIPTCVNRDNPGALLEGWAAQPVVDLDTLFTPPFTVE